MGSTILMIIFSCPSHCVCGLGTVYRLVTKMKSSAWLHSFSTKNHTAIGRVVATLEATWLHSFSTKNHTAIGRVVATLEAIYNVKVPHQSVVNAYLHFEALTTHEYSYSCVRCGIFPPVLIMDLNKKTAFRLSGNKYE